MNNELNQLEKNIRYSFNDKYLLEHALMHKSSCIYDHFKSNERLEFLGDAVLQLAISTQLYKKYPKMPEGKLAKTRASLVCQTCLAKMAKKINVGEYIKLGKGEILSNGNDKPSILSDAFEAILGAIYLDGGFEKVSEVLDFIFENEIEKHIDGNKDGDFKTKLQEYLQKDGNVSIKYVTIKEDGLPHDMDFYVDVFCNDEKIGSGFGKSKKNAEQDAAKSALERFNN